MTRREIENRLLSEGARFFPEAPLFDFVSLGEEISFNPICAPREVGLTLQFEVRNGKPCHSPLFELVNLLSLRSILYNVAIQTRLVRSERQIVI